MGESWDRLFIIFFMAHPVQTVRTISFSIYIEKGYTQEFLHTNRADGPADHIGTVAIEEAQRYTDRHDHQREDEVCQTSELTLEYLDIIFSGTLTLKKLDETIDDDSCRQNQDKDVTQRGVAIGHW